MEDADLQQQNVEATNSVNQPGPPTTGDLASQNPAPPEPVDQLTQVNAGPEADKIINVDLGAEATPTALNSMGAEIVRPNVDSIAQAAAAGEAAASQYSTVDNILPVAPTALQLQEVDRGDGGPHPVTQRVDKRRHWLRLGSIVAGVMAVFAVPAVILYLLYGRQVQQQANSGFDATKGYIVTTVPLTDFSTSGSQLDTGKQVVVNGPLQLNNSFVIAPSTAPNKPLPGQVYLDQTTQQLFFYNGNKFVEVSTADALASINSQINQLNIVNQNRVLSIQGATGNVSLVGGGGISVNGLTIANTGVLSVGGTSNQVGVSVANGNVTLSLPQDIAQGSSPTFSNQTLNGQLNLLGNAISPTSGLIYQFNTATDPAGTWTICTTAGNCGGTGGVGGSGTSGTIAKFTGTGNTLGDSLLTESGATIAVGGTLTVTGTTSAASFSGSGASLTALNASELTSGTLADTRLSVNVPLLASSNTFSGVNSFSNASNSFTGNGAGLSSLNASNITSGTLVVANGGTGANAAPAARTNLGAAASGANSDITSLVALSSIQPTASLTIGSTSQTLTLQGGASTSLTATAGGITNALVFGTPTGSNHTITIPDATGTVCLDSGNCLGTGSGASGAANVALSNLFNTSINVDLLPQNATIHLGSSSKAFGSIFLADGGGNSIELTGTGTSQGGAKSIVIPTITGPTATLCLVEENNCVGTGTGVTSSGGQQYYLPVYVANGQDITKSILFQDASATTVTVSGNLTATGSISAASLSGNGSGVTNLDAGNVSSGTLSDSRLSSNVALLNRNGQTFTGSNRFNVDSSTAFKIQNAAGNSNLFVADTSAGAVGIGAVPSLSGYALQVSGGTNVSGSATFDLSSGNNFTVNSNEGATDPNIVFNLKCTACGASQGLFKVQVQGADVLTVDPNSGGQVNLQTKADSLNAVRFLDHVGSLYLQGDSLNRRIGIGTNGGSSPSAILQVRDSTGGGPDLFNVTSTNLGSDKTVLVVDQHGYTTFKNDTNSTAAFQIQTATGGNLFQVDSSNSNITLNGSNSGAVQSWQTGNSTSLTARDSHASVIANGYIYVLGGVNAAGNAMTSVQYAKLNANGDVGNWVTNSNPLPFARADASAVVENGFIYVIGGSTTNGAAQAQDTTYYAKINQDGSLGSWVLSSNALPQKLWDLNVISANGYIYAIGGQANDTSVVGNVYSAKINADGSINSWNSATGMSTGVVAASTAVANGYVYVIGGGGQTVQYSKIGTNGSLGVWGTGTTLPGNREGAGVAVLNGYIYVFGGLVSTPTYYANTFFAPLNANGSIGSWSCQGSVGDCGTATPINSTALPNSRGWLTTTALAANGYVYAVGGSNLSGRASSVYYASTERIKVAGSLDLVGISGTNLAEGGTGGSLTAGNTNIVGNLGVQGSANFMQGLSISGNFTASGQAAFKSTADSASALQVQRSDNTTLFTVDTLNSQVKVTNATLIAQNIDGPSVVPSTITRVNRVNAASGEGIGTASYTPAGTFSPTSGKLLVAYVFWEANNAVMASDGSDVTITGGSLSWTPITSQFRRANGWGEGYRAFYAYTTSTPPANMQVTVDAGIRNVNQYYVFVDEMSGVDAVTPVVGAVSSSRGSNDNDTFTANLAATPTSSDWKVVAGADEDDVPPTSWDVPAGWTSIYSSNPTPASMVMYQTGSTSTILNYDMNTLDRPSTDTVYGGFILRAAIDSVMNIGNTNASNITIGNTGSQIIANSGNAGFKVQGTNSSTAFQIQNSVGTSLLVADTSSMTVTVQSLVVTANLTVNGHIITGGGTPTKTEGAGIGTGGTCSVVGTDSAGAITITVGSGAWAVGAQCQITFSSAFGGSGPRSIIAPTSNNYSPVQPYVTSTTTTMTVNFAVPATVGSTVYTFNYFNSQ